MDDRGLTAFLDAVVFMGILVLALSMLSVAAPSTDSGGPNASEMLDAVAAVKVKQSDVSSIEDDAPVFLTDMMAYQIRTGDGRALELLEEVAEAHCRGHPYGLSVEFDGERWEKGDSGPVRSGAEAVYPVSTGGVLRISIAIGTRGRRPSCAPRSCP